MREDEPERLAGAVRWLSTLGTGGYPPRTARRLGILNLLVILVVLGTSSYIPAYALYDYQGLAPVIWVIALQNVLMLATPWFHRFGDAAGALWFIAVWYACVLFYGYSLGRDTGVHFYFLPGAAATMIFLGVEHLKAALAATVLALVLLLVCEFAFIGSASFVRTDPSFALAVRACSLPVAFFFVAVGVFYSLWLATTAEDALEREYARSERLLDNLLPVSIAERLKSEPEKIIADDLGQVTILFADIADFTPRAASHPAPEVVAFLNRVFTEFDRLAEAHGLEKIKTIGDAYMVAGGMPDPRPDHADAVAGMALAMLDVATRLSDETGETISVRIGLPHRSRGRRRHRNAQVLL